MKLATYNPQLRVTLHKMIDRKTIDGSEPVSVRYTKSDGVIDLTEFIGDGSSVLTSKSVREPAGGFTLTVVDRSHIQQDSFESLYGLIEPMDCIEIRMKHTHNDSALVPIVMRGFVSEVRRTEAMSAEGKPQRMTVIVGQDYGKIWQMLQILFLPNYVIGQDLLTGFKLFERFGGNFTTVKTSSEFIKELFTLIINPYLEKLIPDGSVMPPKFLLDEVVDDGSVTSLTGTQNQEGTLYNLMRTFTDVGIWNELYTEDREEGVHVVFRPTPALKIDGETLIQARAPAPTIVDILIDQVINLAVTRSDANVANFYWVRGPRFDLNSDLYRQLFAMQSAEDKHSVLLDDYPNTSEALYGLKAMYAETQTGGGGISTFNSGLPEAEEIRRSGEVAGWINLRRKAMVEQNKDNVVLERGSLRMFGDERIKAGMYIRLNRGAFKALYYVTQVDHSFVPYNGFVTTLMLERGLGFVERSKMESGRQSPWIAEKVRS